MLRCLEAEPGNRYQNVRQLQQDLQCQLEHKTLVHADNPSMVERCLKFRRRHPRLTSVTTIAVAPLTVDGWQPVLEEAKKAGIPVILTDRVVTVDDPTLYVTFIGSDFIEEGRRAAEWLAKKTGGKAMIAELQGTPGAAPAIDRKKGFEEALKKYPEMKIIKSQSADFDPGKGKEVAEAFLRSPEGPQITTFSPRPTWRSWVRAGR